MITTRTITVGTEQVTIYETSKGQSWRLVHDGAKLVAMFESSGITSTKNTIFETATRDECVTEAQRLGLSGLDEWVVKDVAGQLGKAYQTDKLKGETPFHYLATIMSQAGVTNVAAAIVATQSSRVVSGKITLPAGGTNPPIQVK